MRVSARVLGRLQAGCSSTCRAWLALFALATGLGCLPSDLWFARMKIAHVDLALAELSHGLPQHVYRRQSDAYGMVAVRVGGYWCPLVEEQSL